MPDNEQWLKENGVFGWAAAQFMEAQRLEEAEEILKHFAAQESEFTSSDVDWLNSIGMSI
jgi:hypothetical protein